MDSTDSGIFKLASVGSYLDALSSITHEMSLIERSNLIFLDKCLDFGIKTESCKDKDLVFPL